MVYAAADNMMVVILQGARLDAGERGFTPLLVAAAAAAVNNMNIKV